MKKGDDNIELTLNICGELFKLNVPFDQQSDARLAERDVKLLCDSYSKKWPTKSERNILAMAAFQFARWYRQLLESQENALDMINSKCREIDNSLSQPQA